MKRALICGINEYEHFNGLKGCVNDITNIRFALKELAGFTNDDIRVVMNDRATKGALEERMGWLVQGAKPGDLLLFHFSGHGSQVRDRDDQDELQDHLDEVLCPYDMTWDDGFITDDFLTDKLRVPDGVVLEVILDCCHSGGSQVEVGFVPPPPNPLENGTPRFAQPPVDIVARHEGDDLKRSRLFTRRPQKTFCLWSACADFQTAADADIGGVFNGAFTFHLTRVLRETQGGLPRRDVLARVKSALATAGFGQVPELAAPAELVTKPLFQR